MARTAEQEWFGDSVDVIISADYRLRPPTGMPGAVRFYVLRPTGYGFNAILPIATGIEVGAKLFVANHGSQLLTILDPNGDPIATVDTNHACELWLLSNATAVGTWLARDSVSALGTSLVHEREPIDIVLSESVATGINLREWAFDMGYKSDVYPFAVRCTIRSGITIGRTDSTAEAFGTGTWPVNSTLLLVLESGAMISGRGGTGGRGGDVSGLLSFPGGAGGHGLGVEVNTALINLGTIQSGGGGGGGGVSSGTTPGAGGGGGAGYLPGFGGSQGTDSAGLGGSGNGAAGGISVPGWAGWTGLLATSAGPGGIPGGGGVGGTGAVGGAAGSAIRTYTGYTLTKLVAGTITGAEVTI
jgi:hypothetical protein